MDLLPKKKWKRYIPIPREEYNQYIRKRNKRNLIKKFYSKYRSYQIIRNFDIHSKEYKSAFYEQYIDSIVDIYQNVYLKAQSENKSIREKYINSLRTNIELDQWHQIEKQKILTNKQVKQVIEEISLNNLRIEPKPY